MPDVGGTRDHFTSFRKRCFTKLALPNGVTGSRNTCL
nr:MAG TPA: hypothetical protein [Caudoviricetes sp.]